MLLLIYIHVFLLEEWREKCDLGENEKIKSKTQWKGLGLVTLIV